MPFVRLSTDRDEFNVYWRSNLPGNDASYAGKNGRPTILLIAPAFLSVEFLNQQFDDPALQLYNLIAFDPPGYGKTISPRYKSREQAGAIDDWVMAALIGDFCLALNISEVHVFAPMAWAAYVAPRCALLFPNLCKSITICGISYGAKWSPEYRRGMFDIVDAWITAMTEDDVETCLQNFHFVFFGETRMSKEESERITSTWRDHWSGKKMTNFMIFGPFSLMRAELTAEQAAQVKTPTLIIHGDTMLYTPPQMAYDMAATFTGIPHVGDTGAHVEIISGAPYGMAVLSEYAGRVNRLLAAQVEHVVVSDSTRERSNSWFSDRRVTPPPLAMNREDSMKEAFQRLIKLAGPKAANALGLTSRNPKSVLSFSLRPRELIEEGYKRWFLLCVEAEKRASN